MRTHSETPQMPTKNIREYLHRIMNWMNSSCSLHFLSVLLFFPPSLTDLATFESAMYLEASTIFSHKSAFRIRLSPKNISVCVCVSRKRTFIHFSQENLFSYAQNQISKGYSKKVSEYFWLFCSCYRPSAYDVPPLSRTENLERFHNVT